MHTVQTCKVKAIIFDLGNVLIDFDHTIAARRILSFTDKSVEQIYQLFFDSELTGKFEEGKISPEDFFRRLKQMLNLTLGFDEFMPIWNEIFFFTEKNHKAYTLAKKLKGKYKIVMLSNINVLHHKYLKKNFSFFDAFDKVFTSYELGLKKPNPLIYKKVVEALGVLPEEVFYTDDRPELVDSARALGIRGFVFRDVEQIEKNFVEAGITI